MEHKEEIRSWLLSNRESFRNVLDVGAGVGTYAIMGRFPEQRWTALEAFEPYVEMFNLKGKYEEVVVSDVREFFPQEKYDLVIMADVLEHMSKQDAKETIHRMLSSSVLVFVCFPVEHNPQSAGAEGNDYETHVDHWFYEEMREFLGDRTVLSQDGRVCAYFVAKGDLW